MVGKGLISGAGEAFERMPEQSERDRERERYDAGRGGVATGLPDYRT